MMEENIKRTSFIDMLKLHEIQISVSKSEVLLKHGYTNLFAYNLWLSLHYNIRDGQLQQRPYGTQNLKYLLPDHLQKTFAQNCYNWLASR